MSLDQDQIEARRNLWLKLHSAWGKGMTKAAQETWTELSEGFALDELETAVSRCQRDKERTFAPTGWAEFSRYLPTRLTSNEGIRAFGLGYTRKNTIGAEFVGDWERATTAGILRAIGVCLNYGWEIPDGISNLMEDRGLTQDDASKAAAAIRAQVDWDVWARNRQRN